MHYLNRYLIFTIPSMEMSWRMVHKVHEYDNSIEETNLRH